MNLFFIKYAELFVISNKSEVLIIIRLSSLL